MSHTADKPYNHSQIEPKWQKVWKERKLFKTPEPSLKQPKKYILDMFPYPSGALLHVGHMEGYVATDILARFFRMKGFSVLHPMGWDAFGLPAENYAIKTGIHPDKSTRENIKAFRRQLKALGLSYDWEREIDTSSADYYKWTQWLFTILFKAGLAYKKKAAVNFCPSCETVLANEQVIKKSKIIKESIGDLNEEEAVSVCERCDTEVTQKELNQWFFKITAYADRLIEGLDRVDWPESTKMMQKNWIGKSEGVNVKFQMSNVKNTRRIGEQANQKANLGEIRVFTTRADTIFGVTALVVAPEHPLIDEILQGSFGIEAEKIKTLQEYVKQSQTKSEMERTGLIKEKSGVFTGLYAVNPANNEKIPVWMADYVVGWYGEGAVMLVPAHDERDFEFAKKYGLPIKKVVIPAKNPAVLSRPTPDKAYIDYGILVNSGRYDGLTSEEAVKRITADLEKTGAGGSGATYHLRDWLVSRQRYWGAPIPMVYCQACADKSIGGNKESPQMVGWFSVPEDELPVLLPTDIDFTPKGVSPLAKSKSFQRGIKCPNCGSPAVREVDTMDTFVDSSWYFLRFCDPKNDKEPWSLASVKKWLPVDIYVGGGHTVQHLLFARFFQKALAEAGLVPKNLDEPFAKLEVPGWILGPDSRKMSKRWGNVITPDEVVSEYGADTLRVYEMFLSPFSVDKPWKVKGVAGVYRFLGRVYNLFQETKEDNKTAETPLMASLPMNKLIKKVSEDIAAVKFNTAIAAMMEFVNEISKDKETITADIWDKFLRILAPFAPHLAEELWQELGKLKIKNEKLKINGNWISVHQQTWPTYDPKLLVQETVVIVIQVNGRVRNKITVPFEEGREKEMVAKKAGESEKIQKYLNGRDYRTIFVPGRLINFVTSGAESLRFMLTSMI